MAKNVYLLIKKERYSNSFLMEKVVFFLSTNACHIKKARVLSKLRGDISTRSMRLRPFYAQGIEEKKVCF